MAVKTLGQALGRAFPIPRKIVQLTSTPAALVALADDGAVWRLHGWDEQWRPVNSELPPIANSARCSSGHL